MSDVFINKLHILIGTETVLTSCINSDLLQYKECMGKILVLINRGIKWSPLFLKHINEEHVSVTLNSSTIDEVVGWCQ